MMEATDRFLISLDLKNLWFSSRDSKMVSKFGE